jgi:ubiquinone/menaquinone biosynthesis C-methylase UbiE
MLCGSCGFSFRLQDGVYELEDQDVPKALGYDEEYYSSRFYDCSEDRISRVVRLARIRPGDRILDLGCGPGAVAVHCALQGAQVFGADPSRAALRLSEKRARMAGVRLELFEFDGKTLPFRDSSFDTIIMADVAEHIDDSSMSLLLDECSRLLLPGGRLVLHTAPALEAIRICRFLRRFTFGALDLQAGLITPEYEHLHIRYHSLNSIRSHLMRSGLSPIVWGEVKYLKDRWPRRVQKALGRLLADQIWALAFKGPLPVATFPEAPYLDTIDVPSDLDMGCDVEWFLGRGFYAREEGGFRWTEKEAIFYLNSKDGCSHLTMLISAPRPDMVRRPVKLKIYLDHTEVAAFNLTDGSLRTLSIDLKGLLHPGLHRIRLEVDRTFIPRDWGMNQDSRKLGIVVYRIGVKSIDESD